MKNIRFHTIVVLFDRQLTPNVHFEISEVTWQFVFEWRQAFFENPKYPTACSKWYLGSAWQAFPIPHHAPVIASVVTIIWIHAKYVPILFESQDYYTHPLAVARTVGVDVAAWRSGCAEVTFTEPGRKFGVEEEEERSARAENNVHVWHLHGKSKLR